MRPDLAESSIETTTRLDEPVAAPQPETRASVVARRAFRIALPVAVVSLAVAVGLNWILVARSGEALPGPQLVGAAVPDPGGGLELRKPALSMLPDRVVQYETIARQQIPGMGKRASEAIYKTLNMNMESNVPMVTYARAEGFADEDAAQGRLREVMEPYALKRTKKLLGGTYVTSGYTQNKGSFAVGWVRGQYMTIVKTSFQNTIPKRRHDMLEFQNGQVAKVVEIFQRTGKQGVSAK